MYIRSAELVLLVKQPLFLDLNNCHTEKSRAKFQKEARHSQAFFQWKIPRMISKRTIV